MFVCLLCVFVLLLCVRMLVMIIDLVLVGFLWGFGQIILLGLVA